LNIKELMLLGLAVQLRSNCIHNQSGHRHSRDIVRVEFTEQVGKVFNAVSHGVASGLVSIDEHCRHGIAGSRDIVIGAGDSIWGSDGCREAIINNKVVKVAGAGSRWDENLLRTTALNEIAVHVARLYNIGEKSWGVDVRGLVIEHHHGEKHVLGLVSRGIFSFISEGVFATKRVLNVSQSDVHRHGHLPRI